MAQKPGGEIRSERIGSHTKRIGSESDEETQIFQKEFYVMTDLAKEKDVLDKKIQAGIQKLLKDREEFIAEMELKTRNKLVEFDSELRGLGWKHRGRPRKGLQSARKASKTAKASKTTKKE
jgi:hypothetical protein